MYFNPRKRKYLFLLNWHQALLRGSYIHHNATQLNNVQHNNNLNATLIIMPLNIMAECYNAECYYAEFKPFMLSEYAEMSSMLSVIYAEYLK
jgi:hypothetical protein